MATVTTKPRPRSSPVATAFSIVTDRLSLQVPETAHTLAGFRAWAAADDFPEGVRVTFLQGEILLDMSNEELETHVLVKAEITRVLMNLNRELKLGKIYADGALLSNEEADVSSNPDASFTSWQSIEQGRVRLVPREGHQGQFAELEGTPDWVLEVVSDSSVQKDMRRLRAAYHRAGIPEYWLVDARGQEIAFQILWRRKNGYATAPSHEGWQRSRVFGRNFRLVRERDRLDTWEYTLQVQAD
jgi:Uma2 family endonuclease